MIIRSVETAGRVGLRGAVSSAVIGETVPAPQIRVRVGVSPFVVHCPVTAQETAACNLTHPKFSPTCDNLLYTLFLWSTNLCRTVSIAFQFLMTLNKGCNIVAGMSLFKAREWWCTTVGESETFDLGCLCVADITGTRSGR